MRAEFYTRWLDEWLKQSATGTSSIHAPIDAAAQDAAIAGALAEYLNGNDIAANILSESAAPGRYLYPASGATLATARPSGGAGEIRAHHFRATKRIAENESDQARCRCHARRTTTSNRARRNRNRG